MNHCGRASPLPIIIYNPKPKASHNYSFFHFSFFIIHYGIGQRQIPIHYSSMASSKKLTGRKPSLQEIMADFLFFIQPS